MTRVNLHVEHLTRVEGHGDIVLSAKSGTVEKVQWVVTEAPRLFEAFVKGKPYTQLAQITSRICGICSIGHTLASLKATEAAMGIEITPQAVKLRKLALHAENLQSHVLHVGYLIAPDLLCAGSVFPLLDSAREVVLKIVALHRTANEMSDTLCGRTTHPLNLVVGGVWRTVSPRGLHTLHDKLTAALDVADDIGDVLLSAAESLPSFSRDTEYIALVSDNEYALYDGVIGSSDTGRHAIVDYRQVTNEFVVPHSTAKYAKHVRESYMVGALARFNLNFAKLTPHAKLWAQKLGLKAPCTNPFMNSVAQFVECLHSIEDSLLLIDELLTGGLKNERRPKPEPRAGQGVGAVEVPRGLLIHDYTYDEHGSCTKANCVIPTNQNHNNIQLDLEAFAPTLLSRPKEEIELNLEMLVRAYDPCISCSTHYVTVAFV